MAVYHWETPIADAFVRELNVGDLVYLSGKIFTARDRAHYRLRQLIDSGMGFEENLAGFALFHAGPIIGFDQEEKPKLLSIGPTTSIRMEPYSDLIGRLGCKAIIGKGGMGPKTTQAMQKYGMVYLLAAHGCAAVHTKNFTHVYRSYWMDEYGMPEALWVMECRHFGPLIIGIDAKGRNLFEETKEFAENQVKIHYPALERSLA